MRSRTNETRNRNKKIKFSKLMIFGMTDNKPKVIEEIFKELFGVTNFFNVWKEMTISNLLPILIIVIVIIVISILAVIS